jgi:HK97 family phage portal protein
MANFKAITEIPSWFDRLASSDGVPDNNATLYGRVPYLFRVIQLRCDTLAGVPVKVYRLDDEDEVDEQEWPFPTPLERLLWQWEAGSLLSGAAYGEIVRNNSGYQKDVQYRNPFGMHVDYRDGVITIKQNQSGAIWENNIFTGNYEMVYMAEYDPGQDILPGVAPAATANMDVKLLYALAKFPEMYFEGGAMPVTLLGIDTTDKNEISRVEQWFKRSATTIKNAFRVLGIRAGSITPTTLTPLLKDLTMPELNAEAKHNIATAFSIPRTMLDSQAANYATAVEERKSFYEDTIKPRAHRYESALNEQLLAREGLRIEFAFNELELFQEDESERADLLLKLTQAGLPIEVALEQAGYKLSEEQIAQLSVHQDELDEAREIVRYASPLEDELGKWQRFAEKRIAEGKALREFESEIIPAGLHGAISGALEGVTKVEDVKRVFEGVIAWEGYP